MASSCNVWNAHGNNNGFFQSCQNTCVYKLSFRMGGWPLGASGIWLIWRRVHMETLWIPTQGKMQRTWCVLRGHQTATFVAPTSLQTHLRVTRWLWNPFFDPLRKQPMIAKPTSDPLWKKLKIGRFGKNHYSRRKLSLLKVGFGKTWLRPAISKWVDGFWSPSGNNSKWVDGFFVSGGQQRMVGPWVWGGVEHALTSVRRNMGVATLANTTY